jgi:hypothetical protein
MASLIYTSLFRDCFTGAVDLDSDTFYGMLVTSGYTANKDHDKRDDITNEVSGTGYAAGGHAVTITSVTLDTTNDRVDVAVSVPDWTGATISAAGMVVYKHRGGAASADELAAFYDFGGTVTSTNGTFSVTPSSPLRVQN